MGKLWVLFGIALILVGCSRQAEKKPFEYVKLDGQDAYTLFTRDLSQFVEGKFSGSFDCQDYDPELFRSVDRAGRIFQFDFTCTDTVGGSESVIRVRGDATTRVDGKSFRIDEIEAIPE